MSAGLVLAVIATSAVWVGRLYLAPFGRCGKCKGRGNIQRGRRRPACPRCKGRIAFKIRDEQRAAARYQRKDN